MADNLCLMVWPNMLQGLLQLLISGPSSFQMSYLRSSKEKRKVHSQSVLSPTADIFLLLGSGVIYAATGVA